jgi:predicted XRE-type DNA-binding protein
LLANQDIRKAIERAGLRYWQVAYAYGVTDGNFSRILRQELFTEKKEKIFTIIRALTNNQR